MAGRFLSFLKNKFLKKGLNGGGGAERRVYARARVRPFPSSYKIFDLIFYIP